MQHAGSKRACIGVGIAGRRKGVRADGKAQGCLCCCVCAVVSAGKKMAGVWGGEVCASAHTT